MIKNPMKSWKIEIVNEIFSRGIAIVLVLAIAYFLDGESAAHLVHISIFMLIANVILIFHAWLFLYKPSAVTLYRLPQIKAVGDIVEKRTYTGITDRYTQRLWNREWVTLKTTDGQEIKAYISTKIPGGKCESLYTFLAGDVGTLYYRKGKKVDYFEYFELDTDKEPYYSKILPINGNQEIPKGTDGRFIPSPELMKDVIRNLALSSKFRTFTVIFALFAITSFVARLLLFPDNVAGNQLFSALSILLLVPVTGAVACLGFWKFRNAFLSAHQSSPSTGLNFLKCAAFFSMIMTPIAVLTDVLLSAGFIETISPSLSNNPLVTAVISAIAVGLFIIILGPVIVYYILAIRTINFVDKIFNMTPTTFPRKTITVFAIMTRIVGIAFFLIGLTSIFNASGSINLVGSLASFLNAVTFIMMASILRECRNNIQKESSEGIPPASND